MRYYVVLYEPDLLAYPKQVLRIDSEPARIVLYPQMHLVSKGDGESRIPCAKYRLEFSKIGKFRSVYYYNKVEE